MTDDVMSDDDDAGRIEISELRNLGLTLIVFVAVVCAGLAVRAPLGHDESVYMLRARDLMEGGWSFTSGAYWNDYRAPGLPIMLAAVGRLVGLHVTTSRGVVVVLAMVTIVAVWWMVRQLVSRFAADCTAVLLALTGGFILSSSTLLADVPGAAFSMLAVAVYVADIRRGALRTSMYLVPILTFAATATRFGAPFTIAAGLAGMSLLVVGQVVRTRNWVLVVQVLTLAAATALTSALVVMTGFVSVGETSPATANRDLIDGRGLTASMGLRDLWHVVNPVDGDTFVMWTLPFAFVFAAGLALVAVATALGSIDRVTVLGLAIAAVASLAALVVTVGQIVPNYLALTLPYWAALSGIGIAWGLDHLARALPASVAVRALAVVVIAGIGLAAVVNARDLRTTHHGYARSFDRVVAASLSISETWDGNCTIATSYTPQVGYYSECDVIPTSPTRRGIDEDVAFALDAYDGRQQPHEPIGYLFVEGGKRQPTPDQVAASTLLQPERYFEVGEPRTGRRQYVWLQRLDPCVLIDGCG